MPERTGEPGRWGGGFWSSTLGLYAGQVYGMVRGGAWGGWRAYGLRGRVTRAGTRPGYAEALILRAPSSSPPPAASAATAIPP
ncbi:hypothetical protein Slala02_45500 [Streptomyces lavendulae subsp. lavendulae]|nr:hypothetical protein Slala02_45500 [Streptomyces lavendulae subsp. lavendulae]